MLALMLTLLLTLARPLILTPRPPPESGFPTRPAPVMSHLMSQQRRLSRPLVRHDPRHDPRRDHSKPPHTSQPESDAERRHRGCVAAGRDGPGMALTTGMVTVDA